MKKDKKKNERHILSIIENIIMLNHFKILSLNFLLNLGTAFNMFRVGLNHDCFKIIKGIANNCSIIHFI